MNKIFELKQLNAECESADDSNRVYIVGADTYIGAHLAKYWLKSGSEVCGCGMSLHLPAELESVHYMPTDYKTWSFADLDYDWIIICLEPPSTAEQYLGIMRSFCDYVEMHKLESCICYISTFLICKSNSKRAITEDCCLTPRSEYEMAIAAAESYLAMRSYRSDNILQAHIIRMGELYGCELTMRDANVSGLLRMSIRDAMDGRPLTMYGLGLKKRTVTHVADACRFAISYMNLDFAPRRINVPGEKMQIVKFLMAIACHYGVDVGLAAAEQHSIFFNRYAGDQALSDSLARSLVPYKAQHSFNGWLSRQPVSKLKKAEA